jgi:hypothetical protein
VCRRMSDSKRGPADGFGTGSSTTGVRGSLGRIGACDRSAGTGAMTGGGGVRSRGRCAALPSAITAAAMPSATAPSPSGTLTVRARIASQEAHNRRTSVQALQTI